MKLGISLGISRLGGGPSGPSFSSSVSYVNGGSGQFAGSTFIFTATSTLSGDWMFVMADGANATDVLGGSGAAWTRVQLTNVGGFVTTLFYRQLSALDAGAVFTITGGSNAGPAEWIAYRGVASVGTPQTQVSTANSTFLIFSPVTLSNKSGVLLGIISEHGSAAGGSWSAPPSWNTRVAQTAFGPKWLGEITSSIYGGTGLLFSTTVGQVEGQVGWVFELIGT